MAITTVLFDLDGTLLPMDQEEFIRAYFSLLAKKLAPRGYDPKALYPALLAGIEAMVVNDGSRRNEEAFWSAFSAKLGERVRQELPLLEEFYRKEFQQVQQVCGYSPHSRRTIDLLKQRGIRCILATNPLFPAVATESRIRWAGLSPEDFSLYTTYENSCFCKPNLQYYRQILAQFGLSGEECIMVGNDVAEDMIAEALGMEVFLLTDCLINKPGTELSRFPHGGFPELEQFLLERIPPYNP